MKRCSANFVIDYLNGFYNIDTIYTSWWWII